MLQDSSQMMTRSSAHLQQSQTVGNCGRDPVGDGLEVTGSEKPVTSSHHLCSVSVRGSSMTEQVEVALASDVEAVIRRTGQV